MASWATEDPRRPLHASIRVKDLQQQIAYYITHFGMQVLKQDQGGSTKNAFLGYGPLTTNFAVRLLEDGEALDLGTGFGHFGIVLPDVYAAVAKIKDEGGKVTRDAGPVKGGKTVIAFVEDPSGYKWELIQRGSTPEPLCQVMLRVGDLPRSIEWYKDVLGMQLARTRDNPEYKYTLGFMGYGPEETSAVLELTYNYGSTTYTKGNAYNHVALSTSDVHRTAEQIQNSGGKILQQPAPLPDLDGCLGCLTEDPDGWRVMLIEEKQQN